LSSNIGANLWDERGDKLSVQYTYAKRTDEVNLTRSHSILTNLNVKVTDRLNVSSIYEYNFLDSTRVQMGLGFRYKANCWAIDGLILDKTNVDHTSNLSYEFKIELFGLGEFGI
jgi:lipopolysaccharide assembly outer membrane protein LptD (OstA)